MYDVSFPPVVPFHAGEGESVLNVTLMLTTDAGIKMIEFVRAALLS